MNQRPCLASHHHAPTQLPRASRRLGRSKRLRHGIEARHSPATSSRVCQHHAQQNAHFVAIVPLRRSAVTAIFFLLRLAVRCEAYAKTARNGMLKSARIW